MGELVIAHQNAIQGLVSLIDQAAKKEGVGERTDGHTKLQEAIEERLAAHAEVVAGFTGTRFSAGRFYDIFCRSTTVSPDDIL